jgi:hypothetical protein
MAQQRRTSQNITKRADIGSGPYLARIISHLDPSFMGSLEVTLLREQGNIMGDETQTYIVRCAMPFFGYTGFEFMGNNDASKKTLDGFNDTQKSYGMWFVPPDVGVTVIVVFVNGDPTQGFWIGCVPARFSNHMVPAIGGSTQADLDPKDKQKYGFTGKTALPVAEINRKSNTKDFLTDPEKIKKAVHPIADRFLDQGLLDDDVRGTTTTTSRREAPSMVFGISTPGPRDKRDGAKKASIGTKQSLTPTSVPVSRLGGTQFVMDDGDERFVRATPAKDGPVKYIDLLNGTVAGTNEKTNEKGDPTIPYNEYFRVRTRTGHQILMHNSEDLIYIGNARGTTWIELTSNGKIDIFAQDSISIHTENDLNIVADRDINMEAGRNINMKASKTFAGEESGSIRMEAAKDFTVLCAKNGKITVVEENFELKTGKNNNFTAGEDTNILSGKRHYETATRIDMNGPAAKAAAEVEQLSRHENPTTSVGAGWSSKYQSGTVERIVKRVPMHEPWLLHENQAPQQVKPSDTDRDVGGKK